MTANSSDNELVELIAKIERDLNDVDKAMDRLDKGTYFTDEVTGSPISADHLTRNPLARRNN